MKRFIIFLLISLLTISASFVFADGRKGEGEILIGEVIYNLSQPYQQAHAQNAELYAEELGIDIIIVDGRGSADVAASAMDEAVRLAMEQARKGDIVLLSPACASFDWFDNYEHRGRMFKELVMSL